ncbi:MAG TPA: hotdog fold thioesterase [Gammaproteobacteria bacterium]|nr:hotdog fold thioesterase [Gammaproteobacteria bacterium]
MSIWFQQLGLGQVADAVDRYLAAHLGIRVTGMGEDYLEGTMPVDDRTRMPLGLLHGGASCVLAESLASYASYLCIDPARYGVVGLEINASHLRGVPGGMVTGVCRPMRLGRSSHVWSIEIRDDRDRMVCISRMTTAVRPLAEEG